VALPTERTVTGTYVNPVNGEPYDGTDGSHYVIFEPVPERWTDQGGNQILLGGGKVTLDENGHFSESLVCTDASGVLPEEGRLWRIRQFVGGAWDVGTFSLPQGSGSLDITDILSVDVCGVEYVPIQGPPGNPGSPGSPGADGASAYEVAVEEGFVGTEEQWLASLVGPQGPVGPSGGLETGIATGGDISASLSNPLAVDINPLTGQIVDYLQSPPVVTHVESTSVITVELDSVAQTRDITWLLMDADLNVYQQGSRPLPEDRRTFIVIGMVAQHNGSIFLAQSIPTIARNAVNQLYDLMDAIGAFNISGNDVSPNGANLRLNVGSGQVFSRGWNHFDGGTETNNPHIVPTSSTSPAAWIHLLRDTDLDLGAADPIVDVGHYDSGGTLTPVPGGEFVLHQLWMLPPNEGSEIYILQYGQQTYADLESAVGAAGKEAFSVNEALPGNAINLGFLAVSGTAANLSDASQALFVKAGKFGSGPSGGAAVDLSGYAQLSGAEFTGTVSSLRPSDSDVAQSSRALASTNDMWRRLADGEMQWGSGSGSMDTFLRRLSAGVLALIDSDFLVGQEDAKSYRFRQSGTALDLDASGADLFLSVYELVNFLGEQHTYLRLESGEFTAHASGKWVFGDGPFDTTGHTLDGAAGQAGFFGATPVGQQSVSGARTTGAGLESLLNALEALGLIVDSTTAGESVVETVNGYSGPDVSLVASDVGVGDVVVAASDSRNQSGADFVCTGTDDHLVIQQAIDLVNAAPGKGNVRLLDGTFSLGATINWPSGVGLGLIGSGWGTVLKLADGMNDNAITFSGDETRSTFSNFTLDGNLANQTIGPNGGIWAMGAVECVFQRIHFTSIKSTALVLSGMNSTAFGHNNIIAHCLFDNANTSTFEGSAIYMTSNDENLIVACDFQFLGGSGMAMGMIHDSAGTQTILGCNFVNGGNSRPAIRVQDASATKIIGCNFDGVAGDAVFIAATNCLVEGNTIFGIGAVGTAGAFSGIHLEFGATGNLVANNSIASHTVNGAARSLIREESVGGSGSNLIVGNMLITKGTLSVGALDLNAPGTIARSNFGGGPDGDPVLTTDMVGVANGVASLDSTGKVPAAQMPDALVTSVNGEDGDVTLTAADVGALDQTTADGLYVAQDSLWINGMDHGVVGDGATDDAPAINAILDTSPAGSVIALPPRTYAIDEPIVVPPGKTLMTLRSDLMTVTDLYEPNAQIKPLGTFTGVAAIRFLDATDGGYADISGEQRILNVTLDGGNLGAGVDGIQAKGNVQNVALRDVTIRRFPNSGIYCGLQGGIAPYSWRMHRVMLDNNHAHGFFGERMVDLTAVDCQAIGNWSNGWMLQNAANSQMVGCRAEWNGNHGFYLSGNWGNGAGSGGMLMSGCSTDRNGFNGVYLDCTGTPPIVISNLMTRRDGRNGGTGGGGYAGLAANGATTPLIIGDWTNFPGVDDGGGSTNSPQYGASFTNTSHVQIDNAYLHAATAGLNDGGGNGSLYLGTNITYVAGTTSTYTKTPGGGPAHIFDVAKYGAVGDGKLAIDAAMTSGSAVLTCSTSAPFKPADVGKNILVLNAGTSGETITGTILSYTSATQVTLSVNAASTVTGVPVLWATDDTVAIQRAIDAAVAYGLAHSYAATVYIPPARGAFYGVAGALKTGGSTLGNSQLTLPVVPATGRKLTLSIKGDINGSGVQHWQQTYPNTTGSTLVSFGMFANATAQVNSINANGNAAVIGGPSQPGGYGVAPGVFSNVHVDIGDLSILTCHSRNGLTYSALDLSGVANARLRDMAVSTSGTVAPPGASYQNPNLFATGLAIGILLPANGANDNTVVTNLTIGGGYTYGILVTEHTDIYAMRILYCWAAFCPVGSYYGSVGAAHSIHATLLSIETCTFLVYIFGPGTGGLGPTMYLKIDTETSTPRFGDRTSGTGLAAARGEITLAGLFTAANLTVDSPTGLRLRNSQLTFPVTTKTSAYTATYFDQVILVDATSGGVTITLPTATGRTDPITVKKIDSSGNAVTVDGNASETIDGATTKNLAAQWDSMTLIPSGGNWFMV